VGLLLVIGAGMLILFSADNQSLGLIIKQGIWVILGIGALLLFAQIPPERYRQWAPVLFAIGVFLLFAVMLVGRSGKGAQRWLDLGFFHFQPSEIMKLAMPMMLAWILDKRTLPPGFFILLLCAVLLIVPVGLTAKQPDLGTALIILFTGICVL